MNQKIRYQVLTSLVIAIVLMGGKAIAQFPANIGKIPAGKSITICYEVTVDDDTPPGTTEVCEQGELTYDNPNAAGTLSLKTDDPDVGGAADPTCTEIQVCEISSITDGIRACEAGSTTYSQEITVTYIGASGNLDIDANGIMYSFAIGVSPQTVTLTGLPIDGAPVTVKASFPAAPLACERTEIDLFTAPTLLTVDAGMDEDICFGDNAMLNATPAGGTPNYEYLWAPGALMTQMINVSPPNTTIYTVTVTDDIGCEATDEVTVNVEFIPVISDPISGPDVICPFMNNLPYSIPPIANATSYTWSFSDASATIMGMGPNVTINFDGTFTGGTLSVKATNECGTSLPQTLIISAGSTEFCELASCLSENQDLNVTDEFLAQAAGLDVFHARNRLHSDATIAVLQNIIFKAGLEILLEPGFTVELGAIFLAEIEACLAILESDH